MQKSKIHTWFIDKLTIHGEGEMGLEDVQILITEFLMFIEGIV
jgi:hypothetical protein